MNPCLPWHVLEGEGKAWRESIGAEETIRVSAGTSLRSPPCTAFYFHNRGTAPLCLLIVTMPPWPGPQKAAKAVSVWPTTVTGGAEWAEKGPGSGEP